MSINPLNLLLALPLGALVVAAVVVGALVVGGLALWWTQRKPPARPAPTHRQAAATPRPAAAPVPQAAAAAVAPPPIPAAPPPAAAAPLQADLLLVDDSAVVRAKLRRLFEPAGFRVVLARDGEEALTLLGQGRYGLMVTDLEMPRLDGVGLVRATLQMPAAAAMPILAITGHDDLQAQLNQLQAVAGIYRKPWIDDELLAHVQALVQPTGVPSVQGETV